MSHPKNRLHPKHIIIVIVLWVSFAPMVQAQQNVGVGTATPNTNAVLDVTSTTKGLLIPRVALTSATAASPLGAFVAGMVVYNTATAGTAPNNVSPGFYYSDGSQWLKQQTTSAGWGTTGNAGTNPANNFIGTTDNQPVVVRQNNVRAGLLTLRNTSWGVNALNPASTGIFNTANGVDALRSNTEGVNNTAIGADALFGNTEGENNTANGNAALFNNTVGSYNTANGAEALRSNTTGLDNTANGVAALYSNTEGFSNTANGVAALFSNTTGFSNVAVGIRALHNNTTRSNLVAVGDSALFNNGLNAMASFHGTANTALGSKALFSNTIGYNNTANGATALRSNTTGFSNTAIGAAALISNTSGSYNTANGIDALQDNETGSDNTANGAFALYTNTTGNSNTAFGFEAGRNNLTGSGNVFIGKRAGQNETGSNKLYINNEIGDTSNTLLYGEFDTDKLRINNKLGIGRLPTSFPLEIQAINLATNDLLKFFNAAGTESWHLNLLANGSLNFVESNVADNRLVLGVGGEVGMGKVPLTGSIDSRLVVKQKGAQNGLGIEASNSSNHWDFYTSDASSSLILYYNGALKGTFAAANGAYTQASDRRLKKDITAYQPVLDKINQLEAFSYHYLDNDNNAPLSTGFMAQDVQKLFPEAVSEMDMKNGEKMLGINYQYFTVAAIKGLQEQQVKIEELEKSKVEQGVKIEMQEERIAKLEALIKTISEKK